MRSKADETLVIVETLICPLQISQAKMCFLPGWLKNFSRPSDLGVKQLNFSSSGSVWVQQRFQISVQFWLRFR